MRLVVVCIPDSRRAVLLREDAARWPGLELVEVSWLDLLIGNVDLREVVQRGDVIRIDSPGREFAVELALLRLGSLHLEVGAAPSISELAALRFERGRILWPACWYAGFCRALEIISSQLRACPPHRCATSPGDIAVMFDKTQTHQLLNRAGVVVPSAIGRINSFAQACDEAAKRRWSRMFLKLAHGSSASGAVAIRFGANRISAMTTVEIEGSGSSAKLFNTRRVRKLETLLEIRAVVDLLCPHALHAERWLPKAGIDGRTFDLRVIAIAGELKHMVVRQSRSPMTNLHLLNTRGDVAAVRQRCSGSVWQSIEQTCRTTARSFSDSHCVGIDVMIDNSYRRHAVLEVNAFGDLLPGVLCEGQTTYQTQLTNLFGAPQKIALQEIA